MKGMGRPRSKYPPRTAAQRQRKCRALKRGEQWYIPCTAIYPADHFPERNGLPSPPNANAPPPALPAPQAAAPAALPAPRAAAPAALPAPQAAAPAALPAPQAAAPAALPAPKATALAKASPPGSTGSALALPTAVDAPSGESLRLSLPPAVAARLKSLLDRHHAGKNLTAAERAEAEGLIDIAEFFAVQRMRRQLAAA
jgi:hypothetical protein